MSRLLPLVCALGVHEPFLSGRFLPFVLVEEAARIELWVRTHTIVDDDDWALTSMQEHFW